MASACEIAIRFILQHEGGYINHPHDPGGETKFGISKRAYPDLDIPSLTEADASNIYRRDYWSKTGLDHPAIPGAVGIVVMDAAVNSGPSRAVKFLQEACNAVCSEALVVDGDLGPKTRATVRAIVAHDADRAALLALMVNTVRLGFYRSISGGSSRIFLRGWISRVEDLNALIIERQMGCKA